MARACTVCTHPEREALDRALVAGEVYRNIATRSGTSVAALHRHKTEHLSGLLARAERRVRRREQAEAEALRAQTQTVRDQAEAREAAEDARAVDVMAELRRCMARVDLLFDACDRWLRDPDDATRYDVGPRAEDVRVIYTEPGPDGAPVRKSARLSELLARIAGAGLTPERSEYRHADPRELILKTSGQLQGHLELLAKLLGDLDDRPQINLLVAPEWLSVRQVLVQALAPYPEARIAAADALTAVGAH